LALFFLLNQASFAYLTSFSLQHLDSSTPKLASSDQSAVQFALSTLTGKSWSRKTSTPATPPI